MAKVMTDESNYSAIASQIRSKLGVSTRYKPSEMAAAIGSIPTQTNLGTKTITQNGTYAATDDNLDGYSSVVVNVSGGGGVTKTKIHSINASQGHAWVSSDVNVSNADLFYFELLYNGVVQKTAWRAKEEIAVYTGSTDVYTTIFTGTPSDVNVRIYNNIFYDSFRNVGSSDYVLDVYTVIGM